MDSSAGAARAVPRLVGAIVTVSSNFLIRYCNLVDLLELVMGPCPSVPVCQYSPTSLRNRGQGQFIYSLLPSPFEAPFKDKL